MAYATLSEVKTYLGITTSTDDTLLTALLARAKAVIDGYCGGRTFESAGAVSRYFDAPSFEYDRRWDGAYRILILDEDLCSITQVTNGDGTVLVANTDYVTRPRNTTPYYALEMKLDPGRSWEYTTSPERAINVNGHWAYSQSAPSDIQHACIRLVAFMYRQKDTQAGNPDRPQVTPEGITLLPSAIPSDVAAILAPYRKRV